MKNFLIELREICNEEGIVLIFDEVMTGFRVAAGGAQEILGVKPDLINIRKNYWRRFAGWCFWR